MKYPEFIKKNETIGIAAPSAGFGDRIDDLEKSLKCLKKDYQIKETASVRNVGLRSNSALIRGQEFNSLFDDDEVKMVFVARGGDFLFETLPYIDFEKIQKNPKWIMGASDPTSILYTLTTKYDVATMYGMGAGSFDLIHPFVLNALSIMKGDLVKQESYDLYQKVDFNATDIIFDQQVKWISNKKLNLKGRLIGGCIDVIANIIGTKYDGTKDFINRYKNDGIVWYFDNFALSAESFYLTLLQMKYAGYFEHTKAVLVGRTCFESSGTGMTYEEALKLALDDIPYILNMDIGHTLPKMTLINGAIINVYYENNKGSISFELK